LARFGGFGCVAQLLFTTRNSTRAYPRSTSEVSHLMIVLCTIVYSAIDQIVRIFKTRTLAKFTRQHGVSDASLVAAVERAA
jgi:hypothetical protein